ncbi:high mobility group box domain-containing protein [Gymnopilus junonius]|uniref:High mobility group box domain-containing protein n=1 Tax=Gymnopilus junonius TaxID=109634 RepID=A0A9P5NS13_GYMJU|nr:high mobility group box domain-containing protein [Gymnopilus junonius]
MPTFRNVSSSSYDGTGHQITRPAFTALRTPLDVQINVLTTSATFPNVALPSEIANLPAPDAKSSGPRRSHSRRKDPNHIPRPRNCFLIFRSEFIAAHKYSGIKQQTLSVEAALRWKKMEEEERQVYEDLALREKMAHTLRHPNYVYSPTRKGNSVKAKPSGTKKTASSMSATVRKRSQLSFSRSSSFTASSSDADSSPELEVVALTQTSS